MELRRNPIARTLTMLSVATFILGTLFGYYLSEQRNAGATLLPSSTITSVESGSVEDIFIIKTLEGVYDPSTNKAVSIDEVTSMFGAKAASATEACVDVNKILNYSDLAGKVLSSQLIEIAENCEKIDMYAEFEANFFQNPEPPRDVYAHVKGKIRVVVTALKVVDGVCVEQVIKDHTVKIDQKYRLRAFSDDAGTIPLDPPVWEKAPTDFKPKGYKKLAVCFKFPNGTKVTIGKLDKEKCKECAAAGTPVRVPETRDPRL